MQQVSKGPSFKKMHVFATINSSRNPYGEQMKLGPQYIGTMKPHSFLKDSKKKNLFQQKSVLCPYGTVFSKMKTYQDAQMKSNTMMRTLSPAQQIINESIRGSQIETLSDDNNYIQIPSTNQLALTLSKKSSDFGANIQSHNNVGIKTYDQVGIINLGIPNQRYS